MLGLDPDTHGGIIKSFTDSYMKARSAGYTPVFLVSPHIRSVTFSLLQREVPDPIVISYNEIVPSVKVNVISSAAMSSVA